MMQTNRLSPQEALPKMKEILAQGGQFHLLVTGVSMLPFLRDQRDRVIIAPLDRPPRRGDILFYLRGPSVCVLHRVHRIGADGSVIMCGDGQVGLEPIRREQILGLATHVEQRGNLVSCRSLWWRTKSALWQLLRPLRPWLLAAMRRLKMI